MQARSGAERAQREIKIRGEADPAAAARSEVDYLGRRGLASPREVEAGRKLVAYLLEAKPLVRRATAEGLAAVVNQLPDRNGGRVLAA